VAKRTAAELRAENQLLRQTRATDGLVSVFNTLIKFGSLSFIAYCGYRSIETLAGKTTMANIGINVLGQLRVSETLAWALGGGGMTYGVYQRKLRRDAIEHLSKRSHKDERQIDPGRSSSRLTSRGTTPAEDKQ
jgi:hypothetical protein